MNKKSTKVQVLLIFLIFFASVLSGCDSSDVTLDLQKIAEALTAEIAFDDTLYSVDPELLSVLVGIDVSETTEAIIYVGTGATAEEIVLLNFSDESSAKTGYTQLETHLETQKTDFENYVPAEVARIDRAVLKRVGTYTLLCVTADSDAVEAIFDDASK